MQAFLQQRFEFRDRQHICVIHCFTYQCNISITRSCACPTIKITIMISVRGEPRQFTSNHTNMKSVTVLFGSLYVLSAWIISFSGSVPSSVYTIRKFASRALHAIFAPCPNRRTQLYSDAKRIHQAHSNLPNQHIPAFKC